MAKEATCIGLMSGTSIDAVDAVIVAFGDRRPRILASYSKPVPDSLRKDVLTLCLPGEDHIDLMGSVDRRLGQLFAITAKEAMASADIPPEHIDAIGSHGQTVRHRPNDNQPFTLQLGDPNIIAVESGIVTVADFRRKDMALGGQGAPLVPAFHRAVFHDPRRNRVIVNIGGMANITWIPGDGTVTGFDTGPGNCLLDQWIQHCRGLAFDANGQWAASGSANRALLDMLLDHPFLARRPPKSTGREEFNLPWLQSVVDALDAPLLPEDIQATLTRFTALAIAGGLNDLPRAPIDDVFVCGGGAHNHQLMAELRQQLPSVNLASTAALYLEPTLVEGAAFAWLAHQTLQHLPGSLSSVTGARRNAILGGIYWP
ncbi:MAG: anhydro-N-acetylmuramic acid kinase [Porticoccaceae bacterium]|nr:anhydro-N-acetylmuramic acid kinase [Porticoccaceae bacterium]